LIIAMNGTTHRQHVDLRAVDDASFHGIENLVTMPSICRDDGHPDLSTSVQIEVADLGDGDLKPASHIADDRPNRRPLLLQRAHVSEEDVDRHRANEHYVAPR